MTSRDEVADSLRLTAAFDARQELGRRIVAAREVGITWDEIARRVGITTSGAIKAAEYFTTHPKEQTVGLRVVGGEHTLYWLDAPIPPHGNLPYENVDPEDIYKRDRWICQLCGTRVYATVPWPHAMSKSLDHIVPKSLGGSHSANNVQLAHLRCNSVKGNRV